MKKIIKGRLYDTDTAHNLGSWDNGLATTDFMHCSEILFKKKNGEYFLYGSGGPMSVYSEAIGSAGWAGGSDIIPFTEEQARKWVEEKMTSDEYCALFGPVEE